MAGDWIKVEHATLDKPEILRAAEMLGVKRDEALGMFLRYFVWLDKNMSGSCPDFVRNVSAKSLDDVMQCPGFAATIEAIGWAQFDGDKWILRVVNASRHNGSTAKSRALDARRKRDKRPASVRQTSGSQPDKNRTREEKRREELPPLTPPADSNDKPSGDTAKPKVDEANGSGDLVAQLPDWMPVAAWKAFRDHRRRMRAPMTPHAESLMLKVLDRLRRNGHPPLELLDEAIMRGWKAPVDPDDRESPWPSKNGSRSGAEPKKYD